MPAPALLRRRPGGRHETGDDHLLAVEQVWDLRADLGFPEIGLIDRLVEGLALGLALEAAQPDINRFVGLALEAAGDHHALRDLERDDRSEERRVGKECR